MAVPDLEQGDRGQETKSAEAKPQKEMTAADVGQVGGSNEGEIKAEAKKPKHVTFVDLEKGPKINRCENANSNEDDECFNSHACIANVALVVLLCVFIGVTAAVFMSMPVRDAAGLTVYVVIIFIILALWIIMDRDRYIASEAEGG